MRQKPHFVQKEDYTQARELRKQQTPEEKRVWDHLRENAKNTEFKFRRQHPIPPYFVDFVCLKAKLIVEIDGESHESRHVYDQKRTVYLEQVGYRVIRFTNEECKNNLEGVVATIMNEVKKQETASPQAIIAELTERAIEALRTVYDPEIPVNIYDLGLIYRIDLTPAMEEGKELYNAHIDMTLTTANCPLADMIPAMAQEALAKIPDFKEVVVDLVWEPPWDPSRMSEEARFELDMY